MAPINLPDGTEVSEVILPDGAAASEVLAPDGSTVFAAIPDATVLDDFEDNDVSEWSGSASWTAVTTTSYQGQYSGHVTGDVTHSLSFSAISPSEYLFAQRHDTTTGFPGQRLFSGGNDICRIQIDDGSRTGTDGDVIYFDGSFKSTGINVSTTTWYLYRLAFDFANDEFDLTVDDIDGNTVGTASNFGFRNSASQIDGTGLLAESSSTDAYQDYLGYN